ncbi:hypothetical protein BDK51DRAFT_39933 [Blyttiomyces helicus]|uniref:PH domain-containing protein n=1 Tax=Blyttiomyces helicus TaxID=388810 RepID=A0A4P9WLT1_9FUNG|nr:hypothetical protein BDK51DRAFT_39933 [Blyttiomyces helicus]|eukprot:RKO93844.1 hypothetical protein BDK51DRAFT_39933 [Blyttiomyces helicus]
MFEISCSAGTIAVAARSREVMEAWVSLIALVAADADAGNEGEREGEGEGDVDIDAATPCPPSPSSTSSVCTSATPPPTRRKDHPTSPPKQGQYPHPLPVESTFVFGGIMFENATAALIERSSAAVGTRDPMPRTRSLKMVETGSLMMPSETLVHAVSLADLSLHSTFVDAAPMHMILSPVRNDAEVDAAVRSMNRRHEDAEASVRALARQHDPLMAAAEARASLWRAQKAAGVAGKVPGGIEGGRKLSRVDLAADVWKDGGSRSSVGDLRADTASIAESASSSSLVSVAASRAGGGGSSGAITPDPPRSPRMVGDRYQIEQHQLRATLVAPQRKIPIAGSSSSITGMIRRPSASDMLRDTHPSDVAGFTSASLFLASPSGSPRLRDQAQPEQPQNRATLVPHRKPSPSRVPPPSLGPSRSGDPMRWIAAGQNALSGSEKLTELMRTLSSEIGSSTSVDGETNGIGGARGVLAVGPGTRRPDSASSFSTIVRSDATPSPNPASSSSAPSILAYPAQAYPTSPTDFDTTHALCLAVTPLVCSASPTRRTEVLSAVVRIVREATSVHRRLSEEGDDAITDMLPGPAHHHPPQAPRAARTKVRRRALDEFRTAMRDLARRTKDYTKLGGAHGDMLVTLQVVAADSVGGAMAHLPLELMPLASREAARNRVSVMFSPEMFNSLEPASIDVIEGVEVLMMKLAQLREAFNERDSGT